MKFDIPTQDDIIWCLQTVFDPDFPLIDIWTMGLIYDIKINWYELPDQIDDELISFASAWVIDVDMTLTTPNCPAADILPVMAKNSITALYPEYDVNINLAWEPMRTIDMLKDEDLKRMFE